MVSSTLKITEKEQPLRYPKSVAFIISNEFCERFNYYGMRTILVLYLTNKLHYNDDTATVLFHVFTMLVYLCPLIGALIADSWLGKFKTILYLSIVYAIGGVVISLGAIPTLELPVKEATVIGLVLIAFGTGGIKPCVSAFGGDQFRLPEQTKQLATFFSLFYFAINAGSTISTSITPILREDVHCFGDKDCFSLAFGVPAILMLLSVVIFVAGKKLYTMKPPAGNMIFGVSKCIADAIGGWRRERRRNPRKHWLDYAEPTCGQKMVTDTKTLLKILVLYLPFPVFWALFDQQGSRWTFQATRMDGELWNYTIKPDQMQVINPLLILAFIPLFDYVLYPILAKIGIKRPLQKLTLGGLLAAVAFLLSAFVELKLEATEPTVPGAFQAQLRIYNAMPCQYAFAADLPEVKHVETLKPLGLSMELNIDAPTPNKYKFNATTNSSNCRNFMGEFTINPAQATGLFLTHSGFYEFEDTTGKPKQGNPMVRVLLNALTDGDTMSFIDSADVNTDITEFSMPLLSVARGHASLTTERGISIANMTTRPGGIYALLVNGNSKEGYKTKTYFITKPNSVHMMWQLPQIMVMTAAEIMFSVTGLEFSFTQAPQSMKSVLQACWLLSVAVGNMLVVVVAELKFFSSQAAEFALFAGLMIVDILIFILLALRYKYVEHTEEPDVFHTDPAPIASTRYKNGHANDSYTDNE